MYITAASVSSITPKRGREIQKGTVAKRALLVDRKGRPMVVKEWDKPQFGLEKKKRKKRDSQGIYQGILPL